MNRAETNGPFGKIESEWIRNKIRNKIQNPTGEKYRISTIDMILKYTPDLTSYYRNDHAKNQSGHMDKLNEKMKIMAGPQCCQCGYYVDRTILFYIRNGHKIFGPQEYCQECLGVSDERFDNLWKKCHEDKKPLTIRIKTDEEKQKEAMKSEMDIYRRKEVSC